MPQVVKIAASVCVSAGPSEASFAVLPVVEIVPFVAVSSLHPDARPMPKPILKAAPVAGGVLGPEILALPLGPAVHIVPGILIAVLKQFFALAVLEAGADLALVPGVVGDDDAHALGFIGSPLPNVGLVLGGPPAAAVLEPSQKLPLVHFLVVP